MLFVVVFFFFSFLTGGVWHCVEVSVTVTPPLFSFNPKKPPQKTLAPDHPPQPPTALFFLLLLLGNYALLSLPFVWGASLGTVFTSAVAFFTSASPLVLSSFTVLPLRQQTQEWGKTRGETKKEERGDSVNGEPLSLSLTAKLSALSWLLCHFSKKERGGEKWGEKHARCFEGICFPSWNWMHFTHNGIKLTILARHQIRVHGCHSYFQGTMDADVEWDRAGTVGTMHEGMKDWGITYNTNYNTQEDYTPSGLGQDTMERDFKAVLHLSWTFSGVGVRTPGIYSPVMCCCCCFHFENYASPLCHTQSSLLPSNSNFNQSTSLSSADTHTRSLRALQS